MWEYWIIDPLRETANFFTLSDRGRFQPLPVQDDVVESRVLPGLWLKGGWLWQEPLPSIMEILRRWKSV